MNEFDTWEPLLEPGDAGPPADLKERLRGQTVRALRRRTRMRRLVQWGVSAAACLLLAALAAWWWLPPAATPQQPFIDPKAPMAERPKKSDEPPQPVSAVALEWKAFDSDGPERAERYFAAGDQYLAVNRDPESALRCYRQALDSCDPASLEIRENDTWLAMTLKLDRKER